MSTPSIADADRIVEYPSANGVGPYDVPFPVFEETGADLYVTLDGEEVGGWTATATTYPGFYGAPNTYLLQLTFDESISGHLVIEGRRAPRRVSQFAEGRGVPARDHNTELNTLTAIAREQHRRQNRMDEGLGDLDDAVSSAGLSAEIAGTARDQAVGARNDVLSVYLGELASDPATGYDGAALTGGEWYVRPDGTQRVYSTGSGTWSNAPQGPDGADGVGIPTGGDQGQVLAKASGDDYDTEWIASSSGGGFGWTEAADLPTDGTSDAVTALQAAIDAAPDNSVLVIPPGEYAIKSLPVDPSAWWTADGDAAIDTPQDAALAIRDRVGLTIIAFGVRFIADASTADGYTFYFYRSQGCKFIGGEFVGNTTFVTGDGEASAIIIARCIDCWAKGVTVDRFYRNLFGYRSAFSGFQNCRSTRAGYFNIYADGELDITVPDALAPPTGSSAWLVDNCYMQGGKFANAKGSRAHYNNCTSVDAGRQGVFALHYRCDSDYIHITGGMILETSDQNSGDEVDGIQIATTSNFAGLGAYPTGSKVHGVRIRGCNVAINLVGANDTQITLCDIKDFYSGGILAISREVGGKDYLMDGIQIINNNVGPFNTASTVSPFSPNSKACIELRENNGVLCRGAIVGNIIDSNDAGAFSPSGTSFEVATNLSGSNLAAGNNLIRGTGTNQLPAGAAVDVGYNKVGSFVLARTDGTDTSSGATRSGSELNACSLDDSGNFVANGGTLSGTWRNLSGGMDSTYRIGVFQRIS